MDSSNASAAGGDLGQHFLGPGVLFSYVSHVSLPAVGTKLPIYELRDTVAKGPRANKTEFGRFQRVRITG
jgi:hypothetical protein